MVPIIETNKLLNRISEADEWRAVEDFIYRTNAEVKTKITQRENNSHISYDLPTQQTKEFL